MMYNSVVVLLLRAEAEQGTSLILRVDILYLISFKFFKEYCVIWYLGLIGSNGISAAICGDIYASPPSSHVLDAIKAIYSPNGTLVLCNNYTGDRLNFGMALERFKAKVENAKIGLIYVDDDVALECEFGVTTGRRGLAGGMLIMHISFLLKNHH